MASHAGCRVTGGGFGHRDRGDARDRTDPEGVWRRTGAVPTEWKVVGRGAYCTIGDPDAIAQAFARLRSTHPGAQLLLVGAEAPGFDLAGRLAGLRLEGVEREDYVDEDRLWSLMAACDVCVSLRSPTMGETSGSAIRALVLGRPLVVSDVGWFRELPDEVALKVPVDQHEAETLAGALELLAGNDAAREAMSAAAREYVTREHDLDRVAEAYAAALEEATGGDAVRDAVVGEIANAAAAVGIDDPSELAARLNEVRLGG